MSIESNIEAVTVGQRQATQNNDDDAHSHLLSEVVFGHRSPPEDDFDEEAKDSVERSASLQAKLRHYAILEATQMMTDELQRRVSEQNQRAQMAKKLIAKKTHQILTKDIVKIREAKFESNLTTKLQEIEHIFRRQIVGEIEQVELIPHSLSRQQYEEDAAFQANLGFEQYVVNTEWTETVEETEELLELPHPFPQRPEISPSFVEADSRNDDEHEILKEQQSSQVSPVPSKKPQKFTSQDKSSPSSSTQRLTTSNKRKSYLKQSINTPRSKLGVSNSKSAVSAELLQSQSHSDLKSLKTKSDSKPAKLNCQEEYFTTSNELLRNRPSLGTSGQINIQTTKPFSSAGRQQSTQLQEYVNGSASKKDNNINLRNILRQSIPELKGLNTLKAADLPMQIQDGSLKKSARSQNSVSRNLSQGQYMHTVPYSLPQHTSKHSFDNNKSSEIHSNNTGRFMTEEPFTSRTIISKNHEIKADPTIALALSYISARTFQAFLSRRYQNFELAHLITLISALYEDSIPLNGSQTDLIYKTSWDDIARQLFNAARIIRSLTKLKYSASSDPKSDFIKKLHKIQFAKRFELLQQKFDYGQIEGVGNTNDFTSVTRRDYNSAVKSLYGVLEAINDILDKATQHGQKHRVARLDSSEFDCTEASGPSNQLLEIEETKSDANSTNQKQHRRTSSIPRHIKPQPKAVKIDLQLPLQMQSQAHSSRQNNSLGPTQQAHSLKRIGATQQNYPSSSIEVQTEKASTTTPKINFTNAIASRTNQLSNGKQKTTNVGPGYQQKPIAVFERTSILESSELAPKSPHQQQKLTPGNSTTNKKHGQYHQQFERQMRQAQFQQSLSEFITREKQSIKQIRMPQLQQKTPGQKSTANSFLKSKEQLGTTTASTAVRTPASSKSFLKFMPSSQAASYHSPSMSTASVTFGGQGPILSSTASVVETKPSPIEGQAIAPVNSNNARPPQTTQKLIYTPSAAAQKELQFANSGSKPPRQITEGVLGSQHDERMRRQMAVLMKLAEPVRSSIQSAASSKSKRGATSSVSSSTGLPNLSEDVRLI